MANNALRMPITAASQRGISKVAAQAEERRVILTSHGRPVAVVDSAERLDEDVRLIREAAVAVAEAAADLVWQRSDKLSVEELCSRTGLDVEAVRVRSAFLRSR